MTAWIGGVRRRQYAPATRAVGEHLLKMIETRPIMDVVRDNFPALWQQFQQAVSTTGQAAGSIAA